MSNVLITGGAGFIGSRIAEKLAKSGDKVLIYDNFIEQVHGSKEEVEKLILRLKSFSAVEVGDLCDLQKLNNVVTSFKPDFCYHMAAETGTGQSKHELLRYTGTNIQGTAILVEVLNRVDNFSKLILPSSRAVYGEGAYVDSSNRITKGLRTRLKMSQKDFNVYSSKGDILTPVATKEDLPADPASIYASTKLMQEFLCVQSERRNWITNIFRLQNVFGDGQSLRNPYTGVLSIFCSQIARGQRLNIYEDGKIARDFVYVDDVVSALTLAQNKDLPDGALFNIGSGRSELIIEVAKKMLRLFGADEARVFISGDYREGDVRHVYADISAAKNQLGWKPKYSLDAGLKKLVDWSIEEGNS